MKTVIRGVMLTGMLLSQNTLAFDDKRNDFILGFGAGIHSTDLDFEENGSQVNAYSKSGLATSLKVGAGLSDQFALYYIRNASWYTATISDGYRMYDTTFVVGISGIGASYYFSATAPSGYLLGGFGIGDLSAPFEENIAPDIGTAYIFGAGYEISPHVHLEACYLGTNIDSADVAGLSVNTGSLQFTANYLFY